MAGMGSTSEQLYELKWCTVPFEVATPLHQQDLGATLHDSSNNVINL